MPDNRSEAVKSNNSPTSNPTLLAWADEMAKLTGGIKIPGLF